MKPLKMFNSFGVAVVAVMMLLMAGCQSMHWGAEGQPTTNPAVATPATPARPTTPATPTTPKPPADVRAVVRIKAGLGAPWKDKAGNTWVDETPFVTGGETVVRDPNMAVADTSDPDLYRSERYGTDTFSYSIPVPNGKYTVKLYMAEMYPEGVTGPGGRIFTYEVQGTVVKDLDITKKVGAIQKADIEVINNVEVKDGKLVIKFVNTGTQNPCISGIEIIPA